jgi:hypothetical protein
MLVPILSPPGPRRGFAQVSALDFAARGLAAKAGRQLRDLATASGAGQVGYRAPETAAILRGVGDKLDENRSALDFIDAAKHAAIRDGTSTWDASAALNAGIAAIGGRPIDMTPARCLALGAPVRLVRGTVLRSRNSFDNAGGNGSKLLLLPGANCAAIQTPSAADDSPATHYCGLEGLVIDGNGGGQTAGTPGGIVQWYGQFIGSFIRYCLIANSRGPGLVLGCGPTSPVEACGMDVALDHVWVLGAILDGGEYALDTNLGLNADNPHGDYSAVSTGLLSVGHLFVENPVAQPGDDPRNDLAARTRDAVRFHAAESLLVNKVHVEGALYGITLSRNRAVQINAPSGGWIGDPAVPDSALVSLEAGNSVVAIGPTHVLGGVPTAPEPAPLVKLRAPYESNDFYELGADDAGITAPGYFASTADALPFHANTPRMVNRIDVMKSGAFAPNGMRVGNVAASMASYGFVYQNGSATEFGSNVNQPGAADKPFIAINSNGNEYDMVTFGAPLVLPRRETGAGMVQCALAWVGPSEANSMLFGVTPDNQAFDMPTLRRAGGDPEGTTTSRYEGELYWDWIGKDLYVATAAGATTWKKLTPP